MKRRMLLCLLCGSLAWGQAESSKTAASKRAGGDNDQKSPSAKESVITGMDDPVLTIKGFCPARKIEDEKAGAPCETVVTRAQFEEMATAIRPNLTASVKQQLASLYPRLLVMSHAAEERGLDKQSPYAQMIVFSRMQILTQGLTRKLQQDAVGISDEQIAEYYRMNPEKFEEYTLERLVVPLHKQTASKVAAKDKSSATGESAASEEHASGDLALKDLAQKLRERAAAGEDFLKLQREAFESAGVAVASPTTNMSKVRRAALPETQAAIFRLQPGEVSPVISDPGGHYIYKVKEKSRLPLEQVKNEIRQTIESEDASQALNKLENSYSTVLNGAYFGTDASKKEP